MLSASLWVTFCEERGQQDVRSMVTRNRYDQALEDVDRCGPSSGDGRSRVGEGNLGF
ncbi:MAG: hypothetical protein LC749_03395 [Actinobacteria bacterium]|nr:hypothetical protein [Actinomycetota bacterium]